jgi:membrane protein YdbS with pleckstrin-like domain
MSWRSRGVMSAARRKTGVRIVALLVLLWLIIGAIAAGQRHYFSGTNTNCAKVGTITATILAGPLNYLGVNPKIKCAVPQPSK